MSLKVLNERLSRSRAGWIVSLSLLLVGSVLCPSRVIVVSLPSRKFAKHLTGKADIQVVTGPNKSAEHIPSIHQVYLDGEDDLLQKEGEASPRPGQRFPGYNGTWRASCQLCASWLEIYVLDISAAHSHEIPLVFDHFPFVLQHRVKG